MQENKLGSMKMTRLVFNMSLPLMISLLIQSLYNIVDSIFVARVGEGALTAVSLAFPIQLLMIAVSVGTSVGINALLSHSIGAKRAEQTVNIATTGLVLALIGTCVFTILGIFCSDWFVRLFTEDASIGGYASDYLWICMVFCLGTFIGTMYQRFLQAVGNTFDSMITLVAGALTNLILDPLLIFGIGPFPSLGVEGAAIATVVGQWLTALLAVVLNKKHNPLVQVKLKDFRFQKEVLMSIYRVGLPTIVTQALGSVMVTAANAILISFSPTAVAFFGVYYKLQNFLFMPMNGLGQAAIPIVGYSYGSKNYGRITEMLKVMLPTGCIFALVTTVVFMIVPELLLGLFQPNEQMLSMGVPALRIISITFVFASVTMILGYTVSGLGNGLVNMIGTALRQVILLIPGIWLLSTNLGVDYAWYAFWLSEGIAMLYAIRHSLRILKSKGIIASHNS